MRPGRACPAAGEPTLARSELQVDDFTVRRVWIPRPDAVLTVSVPRIPPREGERMMLAVRSALAGGSPPRADSWWVLWGWYGEKYLRTGEYGSSAILAVDGGEAADELARRLVRAIVAAGLSAELDPERRSLDPRCTPAAAAWGPWIAGPQLGGVLAVLEVAGDVESPAVQPAPRRSPTRCPGCGAGICPIPIGPRGYPAPYGNFALAVERGEARFGGCEVGCPGGSAECPACGCTFVPGDASTGEVMTALTGWLDAGVREGRGVLRRSDKASLLVWSPRARRLRDNWWLALSPSTRERMSSNLDAGVIALRLEGSATVIVPWLDLAAVLPPTADGRVHLQIRVADPFRVHIGGGQSVVGTWAPDAGGGGL